MSPNLAPRSTSRAIVLVLALAAAFAAVPGGAQVVRGEVVDERTGEAVASAEVSLVDSAGGRRRATVADSAGRFELQPAGAGAFTLRARALGFGETTAAVRIERGEEVELRVRLAREAVALDPVVVIAREQVLPPRLQDFHRRAERNRRVGHGRVYTREDLEERPPTLVRHLFAGTPRSARCVPRVFLDGIPVETARGLDILVSSNELEGVEVYWDPLHIPPQFNRPGVCGVVLLWRKPYGSDGRRFTLGRAAIAGGVLLLVLLFGAR